MKACWWAPIFAGLFVLALLVFATVTSKKERGKDRYIYLGEIPLRGDSFIPNIR